MFLIIQTGEPVTEAVSQFGTFDQWFTEGLGVGSDRTLTVNVYQDQKLPAVESAAEAFSGIILTGSPAMVTDRDPWLVETLNWLEQVFKFNIPTFGVCFGHQMLADVLGGKVDYNPKGRNLGHSECVFTEQASSDPLLKIVSQQASMPTLASHLQHVKELPRSATLLGSCEMDTNHVFRAEDKLWGLQFHPEWNQAITATYIDARSESLLNEGLDPEQMKAQLQPCKQAYGLIARFAEVAKGFTD